MKLKKKNCICVVLLIMAACLTAGCSTAPVAVKSAVSIHYERIFPFLQELASVQRPAVNIEWGSPPLEETVIPEIPEYATEEEIAALGIPEDMLAYWMVLNNKKPFISVNQEGQKFYWNEYFWYIKWLWKEYEAYCFMIVDMDGDGKEEIVLECDPGTTHILHYEDGEVYGYQFGVRAMETISKDGIYDASDGAADNYFFRLTELNKDGYAEELLAEMHGGYYEIGGKEVTSEAF